MSTPGPTIDDQVEELRQMLHTASGHRRSVVRPNVVVGCSPGTKCALHGPGPVTVVTFYISHSPDAGQFEEMKAKAAIATEPHTVTTGD